jgi:hypothetical protein
VSLAHEISPAPDLMSSAAIPAGSPPPPRVQTCVQNNIVKPKSCFHGWFGIPTSAP